MESVHIVLVFFYCPTRPLQGDESMNYSKLGKEILALSGGKDNVSMVTHCATRLRFEFYDSSKVKGKEIEGLPGVISVVNKGGQYQVIIGNEVQQAYRAIKEELGEGVNPSKEPREGEKEEKKGYITRLISVISTTFTPFIPAIIGAGMIKAVLAVLVLTGVLTEESQTYFILNTVADAAFFFMPMLLAYGASIKFKTNPVLSMTIAGVLLHPNWGTFLTSGDDLFFMGIPVRLTDYAGSVLPIIITVWIMSYIERFAEWVSPSVIKFFLKPLLILIITAPLAVVIIGPIGTYLNDLVAAGADGINNHASWVIPMLMGGLQPFLLITGTAWAMTPIATTQLSNNGSEMINGPGMLASNIAQGAATLAVAVKSKNKELKQLAGSAGFTALVGITEPSLYGVTLKLKKPLIAAMIGGACGGIYAGLSGLVRYAFVSPGLAAIPAFIGENPMNIVHAFITIVIAFVVAFAATWILGFEDPVDGSPQKEEAVSTQDHVIKSPLEGQALPLNEVNDHVFSNELIGKGLAILPSKGEVRAPFTGEIVTLMASKHAVGLRSTSGIEVLIHVGIDTVNLQGEFYETHVQQGDRVQEGDLLITFDIEAIQAKGYETVTPVIITNHADFGPLMTDETTAVSIGDTLMELSKKEEE